MPSSSSSLRCGLPSFLLNVSTCPGPEKGIGGSDAIRTNVFREHVSRFPESACNPQPKSRGASAKLEGTTIWRTTPARLVVIRLRVASGKSMLLGWQRWVVCPRPSLDSRIRLVIYSRNEFSRPKSPQSIRATHGACPPPAASGMLRNPGGAGWISHAGIPCEERRG